MISVTGLSPVIAAPTAAPTNALSVIGVSIILSGPNSDKRPFVTPNAPPQASFSPVPPVPPHTSSPKTITFLSLDISRWSASLSACLKVLIDIV